MMFPRNLARIMQKNLNLKKSDFKNHLNQENIHALEKLK